MPEGAGYSSTSAWPCPTSSIRSSMRCSCRASKVSPLLCHNPTGSRRTPQSSSLRHAENVPLFPAAQARAGSAQAKPSMDSPEGLRPCATASSPELSMCFSRSSKRSPGRAAPDNRTCNASLPSARGSRAQPRAARGKTTTPNTGSQTRLRMKQRLTLPNACSTTGSAAS